MPRKPSPIAPDVPFGEAVGPVQPLREAPARAPVRVRRPRPAAPAPRQPVRASLEGGPWVEADTRVGWRRPGVQDRALRVLRGGRFVAQAECDLHGCTAEQASARLGAFLAQAVGWELRRVRVIHGRGGGVLKNLCVAQLRAHEAVLAYASAGPADGAAGALRVLLRAPGAATLR